MPALTVAGVIGLATLTDARVFSGRQAAGFDAQAKLTSGSEDLESRELRIDREHLVAIHQAIRAYFKDHHDLPNWLSDLVPHYLPDAAVLISPTEQRTGHSVLYGRVDPKLHTSYVYEFNAGPAAEDFNKGRAVPITCREWKRLQLENFGLVTPILRCLLHTNAINVAYSGDVYQTGLIWEDDPWTFRLTQSKRNLGPAAQVSNKQALLVRVVDSVTKQPIPQATAYAEVGSGLGLLPRQYALTDTDGRCTLPLGRWKLNWVSAGASAPGHRSQGFRWEQKKSPDVTRPPELEVALAPESAARKP